MDNDDLKLIWLLNDYYLGFTLFSMAKESNFDLLIKWDLFNILQVQHYLCLGGLTKIVPILLAHWNLKSGQHCGQEWK